MHKVTKAIFPVAGMGTRFIPATKSVPKEIMTLVDRPLIQYSIDEARDAGISEFIFVTARGKSALEDYFDVASELEAQLEKSGKTGLLSELHKTNMESGAIAYIRQNKAKGLGHAVWCARRMIQDEPFAVILPDDVVASEASCLKQMVDAYAEVGGNMVATMEVAPDQISSYGALDISEQNGPLMCVKGMVEKPPMGSSPSNFAVAGRYILAPQIMEHLEGAAVGAGGEIQLTDAIAQEINSDRPVHGFQFEGQRYDCGSKSGFLRATIAFALSRPDLRDDLAEFLHDIMPGLEKTLK